MRRPWTQALGGAPGRLVSVVFSVALLSLAARGLPACAPADDAVAAEAAAVREAPGAPDAGTSAPGSGVEAGTNEAILGTLHAVCPGLAAQLESPTSSIVHDELVFVAGETYDPASLSAGGQLLYGSENAGGSSDESEVMSFEVLHACEGAALVKTETEVLYAPADDAGANSMTDILVAIGGRKIGVSVTRAYRPKTSPLTDSGLKALLEKKLAGINRSSERVLPEDRWAKQILHIFAVDQEAATAVDRVWPTIATDLRADTIALVTTTRGGGFIYCNPDPALGSECP